MLRRLHAVQPEGFAFTDANQRWAEAQIRKYPQGRQASAIIALLWRAQEQEGWLSRPAIEHVAGMLDLAYIRALEVATFYFMFQLQPVGSVAHVQVCGTLSCMICGAEDLMAVCKDRIAGRAHELSADGKFSWEEVECLGACANAPMAQIGKDYYEDLTAERLGEIIDELAAGRVPVPGPQNGRFASEPLSGLTSLKVEDAERAEHNASVALALEIGDTVKRIDGTEVPLRTPWIAQEQAPVDPQPADDPHPGEGAVADRTGVTVQEAPEQTRGRPQSSRAPASDNEGHVAPMPEHSPDSVALDNDPPAEEREPERLTAPRTGGADDLKRIDGIGPRIEAMLNEMGIWHFEQIAGWGAEEIAWVDSRLKFRGRVERDGWIGQARDLAKD